MIGAFLYLAVSAVGAVIGWLVGGLAVSNRDERTFAHLRGEIVGYQIRVADLDNEFQAKLTKTELEYLAQLKDRDEALVAMRGELDAARHERDEAYTFIGALQARLIGVGEEMRGQKEAAPQEAEYFVNPGAVAQLNGAEKPKRTRKKTVAE